MPTYTMHSRYLSQVHTPFARFDPEIGFVLRGRHPGRRLPIRNPQSVSPRPRNWVRFAHFAPRPSRAPYDDYLCPHTPVSPSLASFCTIPSVRRSRPGQIGFVLRDFRSGSFALRPSAAGIAEPGVPAHVRSTSVRRRLESAELPHTGAGSLSRGPCRVGSQPTRAFLLPPPGASPRSLVIPPVSVDPSLGDHAGTFLIHHPASAAPYCHAISIVAYVSYEPFDWPSRKFQGTRGFS
jgi:hypothetical protein